MTTQLSPIAGKTTQTPNYVVRLVHFTKPESINTPLQVAFEVMEPNGIPNIQLGECDGIALYNYFRANNLLHKRGNMAGKAIGQVTTFPKPKWSRKKGARMAQTSVGATGTG